MNKQEVIKLARELFKIRISSSNEGHTQEDGIHKLEVGDVTSYNHNVIEQWYMEAIQTAEMIIGLEEGYLGKGE